VTCDAYQPTRRLNYKQQSSATCKRCECTDCMVALRKNATLALKAEVSQHFTVITATGASSEQARRHKQRSTIEMLIENSNKSLSTHADLHTMINVLSHKPCRCSSAAMLPMWASACASPINTSNAANMTQCMVDTSLHHTAVHRNSAITR
jgi:hypothetical protein